MPIEVRHDPSGTAVAAISSLAGLTQQQNIEEARKQQAVLAAEQIAQKDRQQTQAIAAQQSLQGGRLQQAQIQQAAELRQRKELEVGRLQQAQVMQTERINAAAEQQQRASDMEILRKQAMMPMEIEMMEEEQRLQDEGWERRYSAKQRQDLARDNESIQRIRSMIAKGEVNPMTGQQMLNAAMAHRDGINPELYPPDPDKPAREQMPGYIESLPGGGSMQREADGTWSLLVSPKDSPEGQQRVFELEQLKVQQKQLDAKKALDDKIREFQYNLRQDETIETPDEATIERHSVERFGPEAVRGFKGMPSRDARQGVPQQDAAPPSTGQLEQELQRRVDAVKQAKTYLREAERKYKNVEDIPPEILAEIMKADEIVRQSKRGAR